MSFYLSKLLWLIINPFNIFIFLTLFSLLLFFFSFKRFSIIIFIINFSFLLFICTLPIGNYLTYIIEKEFHIHTKIPKHIDGILILGGATNAELFREYDQISLNGSVERLLESVDIIKKFKDSKIIFSGGSGILNRPDLGHTQVAKLFYKKMGIDIKKMIFENNSKNTFENIIFSKKIAKPKKMKFGCLLHQHHI